MYIAYMIVGIVAFILCFNIMIVLINTIHTFVVVIKEIRNKKGSFYEKMMSILGKNKGRKE